MKKTEGFVLPVALVMVAVLMMLGAGAAFLSQMGLATASNVNKRAWVRYQAEAGIDAALVKLSDNYHNWPCSATRVVRSDGSYYWNYTVPTPSSPSMSYAVTIEMLTPAFSTSTLPTCTSTGGLNSMVPIRLRSTTVSGTSEYVAELVVNKTDPTGMDPIFGVGLVTSGNVSIPSGSVIATDVWAGGSIPIQGDTYFKYIAPPPAGATQAQIDALENKGQPYIGRATTTTCQIRTPATPPATGSTTSTSQCFQNQPPPPVPVPSFERLRAKVMSDAGVTQPGGPGTAYTGCGTPLITANTSLPTTAWNNTLLRDTTRKVICLAPGVTLTVPSGVILKNTYIIGDATTSIVMNGGTGPLQTNEVASRHGISAAAGSIDFDQCNQTSCVNDILSGTNTFVSERNVAYKKSASSADGISRTFIVAAGRSGVTSSNDPLAGNITITGVSGGAVNAMFWARGSATLSGFGGGSFTGTVTSSSLLGDAPLGSNTNGINFNGQGTSVQRPLGIDNDDLPPDPTTGVLQIFSRK